MCLCKRFRLTFGLPCIFSNRLLTQATCCLTVSLILLTDDEWTPDDSGMGELNSFMTSQRSDVSVAHGKAGFVPQSHHAPSGSFTPLGHAAPRKSKAFFDDDDIDTLLALKPTDLLRNSLVDDVDGDEVDMMSLMRSVAIGTSAPPPGLGFGPPGLSLPTSGPGASGTSGGAIGLPPGLHAATGSHRHAPIGSPSRAPVGLAPSSMDSFGKSAQPPSQQQVVPKPPQLTPEQLANLTPQQLMHMEQWNLLFQQQQMREVQEQYAAQQAAQRQQQAQLLAQHQQLLAQREEAAKRAAAQVDEVSDTSSDAEGDAVTGATSKANRRGRWAGKATARMSPYEIDLIIRAMEHQVASENPFLDDYYNQNVRIMLNPNNYTAHRPICDVAPPKRRQLEKDPFAGCLGRISSGSSRAPRITVVVGNQEKDVFRTLSSDKPFVSSLGHLAQTGGVSVSDERRLMLTIENAFVILLELEDLKQLQHLHIHAARQPSLQSNATELQSKNEKEAQKKDTMIMEHLHQIITLLAIPRVGSPESLPTHPQYVQWEAFILSILRIPKGARMFSRLLLLLPGAVALSVLRVFVRHLTTLAELSLKEEHVALVNIADYIRRVFLQANLDLLDPMLSSLWEDSAALFAHLKETVATKVGFYVLNALLCRVNDLKGKPDITRDPRFVSFLPKFLKFHAALLGATRGHLSELLTTASQNTTRKDNTTNSSAHVTAVTPSNPRHTKPLTRTAKTSASTSEAQMWEFIFYLMLCSHVADKKTIHSELHAELSINSIIPDTHIDIINLKTTFTGVLAQQADPGFETLYKQAQQVAAQLQTHPHQQPPQNIQQHQQQQGSSSQQRIPMHAQSQMVPTGFSMPSPHPGQLVVPPPMMMMMPHASMMPPGGMPPLGFAPISHPMFAPMGPPGMPSMGVPTTSQAQSDANK